MIEKKYELNLEGNVIRAQLFDGFGKDDLASIVEDLFELEKGLSPVPHKLVIVRAATLDLDFESMFTQAKIREIAEYCSDFKSAIVVNNTVNYGTARMWQSLMESRQVKVKLFRVGDNAHDWLHSRVDESDSAKQTIEEN
jgi:hypothetical protein